MKTDRIKNKIWKRKTDPYKYLNGLKEELNDYLTRTLEALVFKQKTLFSSEGKLWVWSQDGRREKKPVFKIKVSLTSQPRSTATPCLEHLGRLLHLIIGVQNCSWPKR